MVTKKQRTAVEAAYASIITIIRKRKLEVRIPRLRSGSGDAFTVGGLMLVFFYTSMGRVRSIHDLRVFLHAHGCTSHNPQPRHLGMQYGFRFLVQNGIHPRQKEPLRRGQYCLLDLKSAHPSVLFHHRCRDRTVLTSTQFTSLRHRFADRCAVCGSKDGEPHFKNALLKTTIERGHADPRRPLTLRNCLPMCCLCNRAYKDKAAFNRRGLVVRWLIPSRR